MAESNSSFTLKHAANIHGPTPITNVLLVHRKSPSSTSLLSSTTHSVTSGETTTTSTAPETTFTRAKCDDYKCVPPSSASNALVRFVHQETCPGRRQHFRMNILDEDGRTCKAKNYDAVQEMESTKQLQGWAIDDDEPRHQPYHPTRTVVKCLSIYLKWGGWGSLPVEKSP